MTSPSTLSPRNSSRSYDISRRPTHEVWVNARSRSSSGSPSISALSGPGASGRSAVGGDVVDRLTDGRDLLGILVGDLETELVFELHDQLDQVERVGVQITLERRVLGDLLLVHAELLDENAADALERLLTVDRHWSPISGAVTGGTVLIAAGACKSEPGGSAASRSAIRATTPTSAPRAANRMAFAMPLRVALPWAMTARPRRP